MRWPVGKFEVRAWRGGHGPPRPYETLSAPDILNEVTPEGGPLFLEVMAIDLHYADVGLGVLQLWLNTDGMAWVRLTEAYGGNYYLDASDPSRAGLTGEIGNFFDSTAGPFAVPGEAILITARQAVDVLAHWFDCGGCLSGLAWSCWSS